MLRYIAAYFAVKLAAAGALLLYAMNFDGEPSIPSTGITIIAVALSVGWFVKAENRPMPGIERLRFAFGNTVAELVLTFAWGSTVFWLTDASFGWEGLSQILGGDGDPEAAKVGLVIGITFGLLPTPIFSALFGWSMTKSLPKTAAHIDCALLLADHNRVGSRKASLGSDQVEAAWPF